MGNALNFHHSTSQRFLRQKTGMFVTINQAFGDDLENAF